MNLEKILSKDELKCVQKILKENDLKPLTVKKNLNGKLTKLVAKRQNNTLKVIQFCDEKSLTDQSEAGMCDINNIMKLYGKTGHLPQFKQKIAQYIDQTEIPNFTDAHNILQNAVEMFYELPSEIRQLMDHDPKNLESFIADPKNVDLLVQHGLLNKIEKAQESEQKQEVKKEETKSDATA